MKTYMIFDSANCSNLLDDDYVIEAISRRAALNKYLEKENIKNKIIKYGYDDTRRTFAITPIKIIDEKIYINGSKLWWHLT